MESHRVSAQVLRAWGNNMATATGRIFHRDAVYHNSPLRRSSDKSGKNIGSFHRPGKAAAPGLPVGASTSAFINIAAMVRS